MPERVLFFYFVSLSLSLSAASKPQKHSRAKFTLRKSISTWGVRWKWRGFAWYGCLLHFGKCRISGGVMWLSLSLLFHTLFKVLEQQVSLSLFLSQTFCFTSTLPLISKGYDSEDSEMEAKVALEYAIVQLLWKNSILVNVKLKWLENSNMWVLCRVRGEVFHKQNINPSGCPQRLNVTMNRIQSEANWSRNRVWFGNVWWCELGSWEKDRG